MSDQTPDNLTILCPGQGAQHVGMGEAWFDQYPVAAQTFGAADTALEFALSDLCFQGPEGRLHRTDVAQAAIYTTSVACYQGLAEAGRLSGAPTATAGLSLGEFTALHLAGAFSFADGLELVRLRGQAMQEAAEASEGAMVALTGESDEDRINALCDQARGGGVLVPANFNSPMQTVVSGDKAACARAVDVAEKMGLKPTPLKVAGAFHSPLMRPAADWLAAAMEHVEWSAPRLTVLSNVTGKPHDGGDVDSIKRRLVEQLTSPVRWSQSMRWAADNLPGRFVELAPGKVLSGLMRRIDRGTKVENFAEPG